MLYSPLSHRLMSLTLTEIEPDSLRLQYVDNILSHPYLVLSYTYWPNESETRLSLSMK